MQGGLIALIVIVILLTVAMVILLVFASVQNSSTPKPTAVRPCSNTINTGQLLQVTLDDVVPCTNLGTTGLLYYIGKENPDLDFIVAPWPTDPQQVCQKFCSSFTEGNCTGANYNGKTAQENYDQCLQTLIYTYNNKCAPPAPIAAKGVTLYYASSPTIVGCG